MTCADTSVITRPLSQAREKKGNRGKEGLEDLEEERGGELGNGERVEVMGNVSRQPDSRRQNVSRSQRRSMFHV